MVEDQWVFLETVKPPLQTLPSAIWSLSSRPDLFVPPAPRPRRKSRAPRARSSLGPCATVEVWKESLIDCRSTPMGPGPPRGVDRDHPQAGLRLGFWSRSFFTVSK